MPTAVDWNAVRFHVDLPTGHVESYFIKANAPDGSKALWIKATILASPGRASFAITEGWAIFFERGARPVAVKDSARMSESFFGDRGLQVRVGDLVRMRPDGSKGRISRSGQNIEWDFQWSGDDEPLVPLPYGWMYRGPVPATKFVSPLPDLELRGSIVVDGREISVDGCKGMQGHNWGRKHGAPYSWGHCNHWENGEPLVIEVATGRLSLGPVALPPRTIVVVRYRGKTYPMNSPASMLRNQGEVLPRRWLVKGVGQGGTVEVDFAAQSDWIAGLYYPNPDGRMTYVANTKLAFARIRFPTRDGTVVETSSHGAAWEFASVRAPDGVEMLV